MGGPHPLPVKAARMTRTRRALALPLAVALALVPVGGALAAPAEGSVPSEVRAYVADGSLVAQLNDVYGPGIGDTGIDFDDTTETGTIERVHVFSDALRAGEDTDRPLELRNEWVVPISIAEEPVGLATIWINPGSVRPELASFVADPELATALAEVPDGSSLVHDAVSAAWLALAEDGTLTPLVPGTTGLSTPVPLDDIALLPADPGAAPPSGDPGTGVGFAIAVIVLLFAIIVVALIVPTIRGRRDDDEAPADAEVAEGEPVEGESAAAEVAEEAAAGVAAEEPPAKPARKKRPPKDAGDDPALP